MVRIEVKKMANGQTMIGVEAENERHDEVVMCAMSGVVGVARKLLGPLSSDAVFAKTLGEALEEMLLDEKSLKVTQSVVGKEAKFMAALYGMNTGGEK